MQYFGSLSEQSAIYMYFVKLWYSDMLIVQCHSVSKVNCFAYILLVTAPALYNIYDVFCFACHICIYFECLLLK